MKVPQWVFQWVYLSTPLMSVPQYKISECASVHHQGMYECASAHHQGLCLSTKSMTVPQYKINERASVQDQWMCLGTKSMTVPWYKINECASVQNQLALVHHQERFQTCTAKRNTPSMALQQCLCTKSRTVPQYKINWPWCTTKGGSKHAQLKETPSMALQQCSVKLYISWSVSWCFQHTQPHRVISGPGKTTKVCCWDCGFVLKCVFWQHTHTQITTVCTALKKKKSFEEKLLHIHLYWWGWGGWGVEKWCSVFNTKMTMQATTTIIS